MGGWAPASSLPAATGSEGKLSSSLNNHHPRTRGSHHAAGVLASAPRRTCLGEGRGDTEHVLLAAVNPHRHSHSIPGEGDRQHPQSHRQFLCLETQQ